MCVPEQWHTLQFSFCYFSPAESFLFSCPLSLSHCSSLLLFLLSQKLYTLSRRGTLWPSSTAQFEIWFWYEFVCLCQCECVSACTCVCIRDLPWRGYIISDQCLCCLASWLIHPFPLDRASLYCPTSSSLACYHENTILPPQIPSLSACPNSRTYPQTASSPLHCVPCDWFYQSLTKSLKMNYLIQLQWKDIVRACRSVCVWVWVYLYKLCRGDVNLFTQSL